MRHAFFLLASASTFLLAACDMKLIEKEAVDGGPEMTCPSPPDLATPASKCAAAKGLAGDNLLCVDFKDVQALTSLSGWDFSCTGGASWGSTGGSLQVNNFGTFKDECTVKVPPINLNDADKQKYKLLTLSLVQRIDLADSAQKAYVYLNDTGDPTRLLYFATGQKKPSKQVTTVTLDKQDLPAMVNNTPQWILRVSSTTGFGPGYAGWQIESIAINGVQ
jgi:hypothetical protein